MEETISREWRPEERARLIARINSDIEALRQEAMGWLGKILWQAPCYEENRRKREALQQLASFAAHMSADFLEANRVNFSEYLAPMNGVLKGEYLGTFDLPPVRD